VCSPRTDTFRSFSKENFFCKMRENQPEQSRSGTDWHPADVLAALKKRGKSLVSISIAHGYHPTAAGKALKRPWPAVERAIAAELGVSPEEIWPSRYPLKG
jgi:Ner family transcriptional regulator